MQTTIETPYGELCFIKGPLPIWSAGKYPLYVFNCKTEKSLYLKDIVDQQKRGGWYLTFIRDFY